MSSYRNLLITSFPPLDAGMTHRKCYELIGNSLNVMVVTHVLRYMFEGSNVSSRHGSSDILGVKSTISGL